MQVTKRKISMNYRDYGEIVIPKGTRTTHQTACGVDDSYNFVAEFGWIPTHENGVKQHGLIWDAVHYGINIPAADVEEITP